MMVLKDNKKHEILCNNNVGVGEDKISNLPDELVHHIFSFLPTKCVMSTCILSKRWKYLSNSIPTLDFRNWRVNTIINKVEETKSFVDFLDTVLCLREDPYIQNFYLSLDADIDRCEIYKWISILMKRKVKELLLSKVATYETVYEFPRSFFTCDSLTVLELDRVAFNVPKTSSFPRLKLLRLRNMSWTDRIGGVLLNHSPILEELSLVRCRGLYSKFLRIQNLALKKLYIGCCEFRECTIKICAPNLSIITYEENQLADLVFDGFQSLVEADIQYYKYDGIRTGVPIKLFKKLSDFNLKELLNMLGNSFVAYINT